MARLEIEGLCKGWDFPVIDRLDLTVEDGEFFVVVGPSGIGKTTLLRLVAGLERADAGTIRVGGRDLTGLPPYRRNVAMTFESYALYPHLTVFENIASPLRARRMSRETITETVHAVTRLLRIEPLLNRRPGEISGGQKQRTALGRTLVANPDVFLLDEPISHLDARIRHELRLQFHTLEALRSVATLYVTHDYAEALSLGDRIGVMGGGGLLQIGTAREIFERPQHVFVASHLGQPTINVIDAALASTGDRLCVTTATGCLSLPMTASQAAVFSGRRDRRITVGIRPQHIEIRRADSAAEDEAGIAASVVICEPLGAAGVVVAESDGLRLTSLTSPDIVYRSGETVRLRFREDAFLYFDAENGRNVMPD